jgi:hypothetical protein
MTRRETKRNFSVQANMKVFELSEAVVEDGFAKKGGSCDQKRQVAPPRYNADFTVMTKAFVP